METLNTATSEAARSPLDESHFAQIRQAAVARGSVRSVAGRARVSGIITASIGGLSLLVTMLSFSLLGVFISLGICAVGIVEMIGSTRVRRGDASACRLLGWNQIALLGMITIYCLLQMATLSVDSGAIISPETRSQLNGYHGLDNLEKWGQRIMYAFYALVILVSAVFQGWMAWSYFRRQKQVEAFNAQTPEWIRRVFIEAQA